MALDKEQVSRARSKTGLYYLTTHFLCLDLKVPQPLKSVSPRTFDTQTIIPAHHYHAVYITYYNQKESQGENLYLDVRKTQSSNPVASSLGTRLETKFPLSGLTRRRMKKNKRPRTEQVYPSLPSTSLTLPRSPLSL